MWVSSKASGGTATFCGALALPPEDELEDELEEELLEELEELLEELLLDDEELEEELEELEELEEELELDELLELLATGPTEHQADVVKLLAGKADSEQVKLPVCVA